MNKVLILKEKYSKINKTIFDQFVESDTTPTVKYLSYMLKMWSNKKGSTFTSYTLSFYVMLFDELLPFIENKDIYSSCYEKYSYLVETIENAKILKEEKSFIRKDNCNVILETDDFLFLCPTTYRGSLKYGASTKWCTASNTTDNYFKDYTSRGILCYLIDKKGDKTNSTKKVAFYMQGLDFNELQNTFEIFNETDKSIKISTLYKSNWNQTDIFNIVMNYRNFAANYSVIKKAKNEVISVINKLNSIDIESLLNNITFLEKIDEGDFSKEKETISKFLDHLNNKIV